MKKIGVLAALLLCVLTAGVGLAAPLSFTIRVTVMGLQGAPLVLQNNGLSSLRIEANGTAAFAGKMPSGLAYNVTVKTPPSYPAQSCMITGGTGTVGKADVNVSVSCHNLSVPQVVAAAKVHSATVSWTKPPGAAGFDLYVSSSPDCDIHNYTSCPDAAVFPDVTTPHEVTGLPNDQPRYFVVEMRYNTGARGVSEAAGARPSGAVFDDHVFAIATAHDKVYVGGDFTNVAVSSGSAVPLDRDRGQPVSPTFPSVNGSVSAIEPDQHNGFYIGGSFTSVGGMPRAGLARILADGSVDPAFDPIVFGNVKALAFVNGWLYVGGSFFRINNIARDGLAALDPSGTLSTWSPRIPEADPVRAIVGVGEHIFVGGSLSRVDGQPRSSLAGFRTVNATTFPGALLPWQPTTNGVVADLHIDNGTLYVGGNFSTMHSEPRPALASFGLDGSGNPTAMTELRQSALTDINALTVFGGNVYAGGDLGALAVVDATTGATTELFGAIVHGQVTSLLTFANKVYVGGRFTAVDGFKRLNLAALDAATLQVLPWNPGANAAVHALAASGRTVYAGGTFTGINAVPRERLAQLDATGAWTSWSPRADRPVLALAASPSGQTIYAGGSFTRINSMPHRLLAAIDAHGATIESFNHPSTSTPLLDQPPLGAHVAAIAASGNKVYVGGGFEQGAAIYNAVEAPTGAGLRLNWSPQISRVSTLQVDNGRLYIGGSFSSVEGQPRRNLAAFVLDVLFSPALLLPLWNPMVSHGVGQSTVLNGVLYFSGDFGTVAGASRFRLAAVDRNSLLQAWSPAVDESLVTDEDILTLSRLGSSILVGGTFMGIAGSDRPYFAAIQTNGAINASFNPNANLYVTRTAVTPDASAIYVAGRFSTIGGKLRPGFAKLNPDGSAD